MAPYWPASEMTWIGSKLPGKHPRGANILLLECWLFPFFFNLWQRNSASDPLKIHTDIVSKQGPMCVCVCSFLDPAAGEDADY